MHPLVPVVAGSLTSFSFQSLKVNKTKKFPVSVPSSRAYGCYSFTLTDTKC